MLKGPTMSLDCLLSPSFRIWVCGDFWNMFTTHNPSSSHSMLITGIPFDYRKWGLVGKVISKQRISIDRCIHIHFNIYIYMSIWWYMMILWCLQCLWDVSMWITNQVWCFENHRRCPAFRWPNPLNDQSEFRSLLHPLLGTLVSGFLSCFVSCFLSCSELFWVFLSAGDSISIPRLVLQKTHIHIHIYIYIHIHKHIHIHTHTHSYVHTCMHASIHPSLLT